MILTDTHLHTSFSSDSRTPMESMVREGIRRGLKTICFTEHYDPDFPEIPAGLDFSLDFDSYHDEYLRMKTLYGDRIEILHGIELGIQPHLSDFLNDFYESQGGRYDFIISSCHLVDRLDPYYPEYFDSLGPKKGLFHYFETLYENLLAFDHYQTAGHLDYAARYIKKPVPEFHYEDYEDILDAILLHLIKKDKALEVNTSGLKAGLAWPNPHLEILKRYHDLGGRRLTIGSDAHQPEHMAYDFHILPDYLRQAGFDRYEIYRKQQAFEILL